MLNNWPLGFYHPATLVKDAQRHGLRVLPIDVTRSGWTCNLEVSGPGFLVSGSPVSSEGQRPRTTDQKPGTRNQQLSLRLGLRYVAGLRAEAAKRIEEERAKAPFT